MIKDFEIPEPVFLVLAALVCGCASVPAGHGGVLMQPWGRVTSVGEGNLAVLPMASLEVYDLRVQRHYEDLLAISADGAPIEARASVIAYHLPASELIALHREVGPDFDHVLVEPVVQSTVRRIIAGFRADALNSNGIRQAQAQITVLAQERLRPYHVLLDSIDLRGVFVRSRPAYAAVLQTGQVEQEALMSDSKLEIARSKGDALREQARATSSSNTLIAPTLNRAVLDHEWQLAWAHVLSSPSTDVVIGNSTGRTFLEVLP